MGIDDKILREVIIPVMAVSRRAADGTVREDEPVNKSSIYIRISIITKKLVKANFLNCWEISLRQSATKPAREGSTTIHYWSRTIGSK